MKVVPHQIHTTHPTTHPHTHIYTYTHLQRREGRERIETADDPSVVNGLVQIGEIS